MSFSYSAALGDGALQRARQRDRAGGPHAHVGQRACRDRRDGRPRRRRADGRLPAVRRGPGRDRSGVHVVGNKIAVWTQPKEVRAMYADGRWKPEEIAKRLPSSIKTEPLPFFAMVEGRARRGRGRTPQRLITRRSRLDHDVPASASLRRRPRAARRARACSSPPPREPASGSRPRSAARKRARGVVISDKHERRLGESAAALGVPGIPCDVTQEDDVQRAVRRRGVGARRHRRARQQRGPRRHRAAARDDRRAVVDRARRHAERHVPVHACRAATTCTSGGSGVIVNNASVIGWRGAGRPGALRRGEGGRDGAHPLRGDRRRAPRACG